MPIAATYLGDILSQPAAIRASLDAAAADTLDAIARTAADGPRQRIIFAGMGSSHFGAMPASITLAVAGRQSGVISASQLLHYELPSIDDRTTLVLISQSGRSAEIVRIAERLPATVPVVGITNDVTSPLALRSQFLLPLNVASEASVTTRTYVATLAQAMLLADAIAGRDWRTSRREIHDTVDLLETELALHMQRREQLRDFVGSAACIHLIGRGHALATVRAGALFIREVAKTPAVDIDAGEFRHGPLELVSPEFLAMIFAPRGSTAGLSIDLARDVAAKGGRAVLVTPEDPGPPHPGILVLRQSSVEREALSPMTNVAIVQLLADALAARNGLQAGVFRWSSKITTTE